MQHYALFSVGDYELEERAEFALYEPPLSSPSGKSKGGAIVRVPPAKSGSGGGSAPPPGGSEQGAKGFVKGFVRKGKKGFHVVKGHAKKAASAGAAAGRKAASAGAEAGRSVGNSVKAHPGKYGAGAAGLAAVAGGAVYLGTRKKRKRR